MTRFFLMLALLLSFPAFAGEKSAHPAVRMDEIAEYDMTPAQDTHRMLRLVPGKAKSISVAGRVAGVAVDRPDLLGVFAGNRGRLGLLGRGKSGIAHFVAKDKDGKTVMARHVFVGDRGIRYIRVRTVCEKGEACGKRQVYFCPDECFEMNIAGATSR